jgi:hypothetical protein
MKFTVTLAHLFWQILKFSSWNSKPLKVKPLLLQNITDQLLSDKAPQPTVIESSSASVFPIMATVGVRNVKTPSNMKLIVL